MSLFKTPKSVERALQALFTQHKITDKVSVEDVKKWIWNATGPAMRASLLYQKKCMRLFPPTDDIDELNDLWQVFVNAWNTFPHKDLGGKSPNQMLHAHTEASSESPGAKTPTRRLPKVIVGGQEMEWEKFEAMLREMERVQEPFKRWIEEDALPKYKKYLRQTVADAKRREEHHGVADVFFQRALHVGFTDLQSIRPAFIAEEFPAWWPTHVMYSDLRPSEVRKSLDALFSFLDLAYPAGR